MLPHLANTWADSAFSAFIWSVLTTAVAYSLWFGFVFVYQASNSASYTQTKKTSEHEEDKDDGADNDEDEKAWDQLEFYYALGVFMGFSAACLIALARSGVPSLFLVALFGSALAWAHFMALMARHEWSSGTIKTKRVLPMVMV